MTTTEGEWVEFTRSDEQIAEMVTSKNGFIVKASGKEWPMVFTTDTPLMCHLITHYWIVPDDPMREMKIRQARTGQPIYQRGVCMYAQTGYKLLNSTNWTYVTTNPIWLPNAEYSFTSFEE